MSVTETILLLPDVDSPVYEQSEFTTNETTPLTIPKYPQTLMEKMKAKYNGGERDPAEVRRASHGCTLYFIFIAVSELYLMTLRVLPARYPGAEEMVYYLQLLCWFVFIQAMANITCVICYNTTYQLTKDNITPKKSLWDNDETYPQNFPTPVSRSHPHSNSASNDTTQASSGPNIRHTQLTSTTENAPSNTNVTEHNIGEADDITAVISWHFCRRCNHMAPPRSHHCKVCQRCVLKRDHHCYMTGVCIGFWNQRYFVFLNFYVAIASILGLYFQYSYFLEQHYHQMSGWDYFAPVTFYRSVYQGALKFETFLFVFQFYTLWWTGPVSLGFFIWQLVIISRGLTSHESFKNLPVRSTSSVTTNFRSVFGVAWPFNFLLPGQILFRQLEDGMSWPNFKVIRNSNVKTSNNSFAKFTSKYS